MNPESSHSYHIAQHEVPPSVEVIIVGGGPTGLCAANLLGQAGIRTLLLERNSGLSQYPKAIALDDEGLRICQAMGLSKAIDHCILSNISAHYISAGRLLAKVTPTSKRNGFALISTFNQPEFETTLLEGLQRFACVTMHFHHTVEAIEQTSERVIVSVRTPNGCLRRVECTYLLACDGGRSTIRSALSIPMQGSTYEQQWAVIDCVADTDPAPIATFFCNPRRPTVTVPSPHGGRRWEFMILPGETEQTMLSPAKIATLIAETSNSSRPAVQPQIIRQAIYTFQARLAQRLSQGRVFLLGDAAHMMPPFGGQGLNSGLRDAHNLCWKLAFVLRGLSSPQLVETYAEERYRHIAQMIRFSSLLGNIVMSKHAPVAFGRDVLLQTLQTIPALRNYFAEGGIKPQSRYKSGFFLPNSSRASKALTGQLLPQPEVTTEQGQRVLLDDLLGTDFALIALHSSATRVHTITQNHSAFWAQLSARVVNVQQATAYQLTHLSEHEGEADSHADADFVPTVTTAFSASPDLFMRNSGELFVVVRPDRYVMGVFTQNSAEQFVATFQRLLQSQPQGSPSHGMISAKLT